MKDIVQNLALYIPFGYFFAKGYQGANRISLVTVLIWAGALSIATESAQIFQPHRYPSATDVVNNVVGACIGVIFGTLRNKKDNCVVSP